MSRIFSKTVSGYTGLLLKAKSANKDSVLLMENVNTAPTTSGSTYGALYVDSGTLYFAYGGSSTALGAAGGGTPSFETLVSADATMELSTGTWTISQSGAYDLLTLNKSNVGAGSVIDITNSGTGVDIDGHSSNWSITSAGVVTCTGIAIGDDEDITFGDDDDITVEYDEDGNDELLITGATGINGNFNLRSTSTYTQAGSAGSTVWTLTAGDMVVSDGSLSLTDADNAESVTIINNSATDIGNASSAAVVQLESTSLTTGCLLNLQLTEGTLNGGKYLRAWDATGGAAVFTVAENGDLAVAGTAGSNALAITAGDVALSDGSITVTDADNAASLSVTNNTATSESPLAFAGSGTFTGSTTKSFMTLTPSGLTSGTALYIPVAAMTTGKGLHMVGNAMTSGTLVSLTSSGTIVDAGKMVEVVADSATTPGESAGEGIVAISADALTTGAALDVTSTSGALTSGHLADFSHIASSATLANKSGGLVNVAGNRTTTRTSGTTADDYDVVSIVRTSVMNGTGGTLTAAGSVLYVQNVATQTAGTLTDSANGVEIVMDADGTGAGVLINQDGEGLSLSIDAETTTGDIVDIDCNTLTTGTVIDMSDLAAITEGKAIHIDATGTTQTTGILVHIDSAATAITGAGRLFLSAHTGVTGTSAILNEFSSAATDESTILRISASAELAAGVALDMSLASMTTGTAIDMGDLDALTTGKGLNVVSDSSDTGAFVLAQLTVDNTAATGSTNLALQHDSTGTGISIDHNGATGKSLFIDSEATTQTGGVVDISAAVLTTGTALDIGDLDALTTGYGINVVSDSSDTGAFNLIHAKVDNSAAVGAVALHLESDALISTNFKQLIELDGITLFISDGTSPNGALTGVQGDICFGADSGKAYFCSTTGTGWTSFT